MAANDEQQQQPPKQEKGTALWKGFVSGGFGGMCLVFAGHPLDLIKVRMQTSQEHASAMQCFKQTLAKEGVRGLYKGMSAPLTGVTPIFAINFWAYDTATAIIRSMTGVGPNADLTLTQYGVAGALAAIPTTAIMAPGERIKCILQTADRTNPKYNGPVAVVRTLVAEGGVSNLFKGSAATLARDGSGSFFYFSGYEGIKRALTPEGSTLSPTAVVFAGGCAGILNWTVAIPFDTVKSRIQTYPAGTYSGMLDCARKLTAEAGMGALWRGLGPAMLRAFPANAACFLGREVCLKFLNYLSPDN